MPEMIVHRRYYPIHPKMRPWYLAVGGCFVVILLVQFYYLATSDWEATLLFQMIGTALFAFYLLWAGCMTPVEIEWETAKQTRQQKFFRAWSIFFHFALVLFIGVGLAWLLAHWVVST